MRQIIINIYPIKELNEQQIAKAYHRWVSTNEFNDEDIIEDIKNMGKTIGINIDKVYYSGFCSRGDGAMFEGTYQYNPEWKNDLQAYAPNESTIRTIAERLEYTNDRKDLITTVKHDNSRYYHANTADISVSVDEDEITPSYSAYLREFMNWMFEVLEKEYDYQMSLEYFKEEAEANDYHFDEEGNLR